MDADVHVIVHTDSLSDSDSDSEASLSGVKMTSQAHLIAQLPSRQPAASLERRKTLERSKTLKSHASTLRRRNAQRRPRSVDDVDEGAQPSWEDEEEAWRRLQQVKAMTSSLEGKRKARAQLMTSPTVRVKGYQRWKLERSKSWEKTKLQIREVSSLFEIWRGSFKTVEGNFGSSVLSYFVFVKWLFLLNIISMVIILATIVLPQALMQPSSFNQSISNIQGSAESGFVQDASRCSAAYDQQLYNLSERQGTTDKILDFFQGTGWMEKTYLFTGFYFNKTLIYGDSHQHYNMPVAFLLATAAYFTITLIAMVKYTAIGMRNQRMSGEKFYDYCNKVFSGWDFSLSKDKAAAYKHKNLFHEYSNDLEEARQKLRREGMSIGRKSCILFFRAVIWIVTLAILAASGYLIYQIVDVWMPMLLLEERVQDNAFVYLVVEFLPSIAITALNVIVPVIFQQVVGLEDYEPHNEIRITIGRTVFLRLASVAVLAVTLGSVITCSDDVRECGNCGVSMCWETYVGQQIYKLVIVDFFVVVAITFFVEFPRKLTVDKFSEVKVVKMVGRQEFDIPKNVLDIVYSQTLCWIGTFFCPLIAIITVLKFFIFFYVKKLTLLKNCIPASRTYRASKSSYFFMSVLMVSFVLCAAAVAYAVGRIPPSQGCGPFRIYSSREFFMFESFSDLVSTLPNLIRDIFYFCGSWLFYVSVLIVLSLVIYYYRAMAAANKRLLSLLRDQLSLAGKDRQFLLSQVNDALLRGDLS